MFPAGNVKESLLNSARVKNTWALVALYFTTFGGFIGLTAWFPIYWRQLFEFPLVRAGLFTAIFSLTASLVRVYGGKLADRAGGENVSMISLVIVLAASVVLTFTQTVAVGFIAMLILAIGMGINNAAVFRLVPDYVPKAIGGASGWIGGLGAFGGFAIPPVMGATASAYGKSGYALGFMVFIILSVLSIGVVILLKKQRPHRA